MGIALFREGLKVEIDHDRPLLAYAYLAQTGKQDDILSGLVPIVSPIAQSKAGKPFDPKELCEKLKELYGIEIHPWVTDELVPNLVAAGVLIPSELNGSVVRHYYAPAERFESISPIEGEVKGLVEQFVDYCQPLTASEEGVDAALIESVFLNQLVSLDFHTRLLKPHAPVKPDSSSGRILRLNRVKDSDPGIPEPADTARLERIKLLCASFILKLKDEQSELFPLLVRIASGAIAAEYILNLREPNSTSSLKGMKFYLDGPLMMSYLDLGDPQAYTYAKLLIDSLASKGAILCIFDHHVEEIRSNLRAALARSDHRDGHGATYRRLADRHFRTYVHSLIGTLEPSIRDKKIAIVKVPKDSERYFSSSEETDLISALGNYNVQARSRDAAAIAAIVRLRQRTSSSRSDFHQARHIFVTENSQVARRSAKFLYAEKIYREGDVPAAVTDRHLAGLMLVLFGAQGSFELAHHRLIANCASALEPSQELLASVTNFLEGLDSMRAEHFRAIMTTQRSAQYMTRFMLEQKMSLDNAEDAARVLEHLEDQWKTALKSEHEAEISKIQDENAQVVRLAQEAADKAQQDAQRVADELAEQQELAAEQQRESERQIERLSAGLEALQGQQKDNLRKDIRTCGTRVEGMIRNYALENRRRCLMMTVGAFILGMVAAVVCAYLAFTPDTIVTKGAVLLLTLIVGGLGSSLLSSKISEWSHRQSRKNFFEEFNGDILIQRHAEFLSVNYDEGTVSIIEVASDSGVKERAVEGDGAELVAHR